MSSLSKKQFLSRPTIKSLPPLEREKRWQQHVQTSKNRSKEKPTPKKNRKNPPRGSNNSSFSKKTLSDCSLHYILALSDPWDCPQPPCVPDNITLESYKFAVRGRGTFYIGTGGVGFIAINPYNPYLFTSGTNLVGIITDSTYSGTGYATSGAGIGAIGNDASMIPSAAVNFEQAYRVVGAGMKICYTGSEVSRSGSHVLYRDPSNTPIPTATSVSTLLSFRETTQVPVDREWHCVVWKPATPSDIAYAPRGLDIDGGGTPLYAMNSTMLALVSGGTTGQSYSYDFIIHFEMTGRQLPVLTKSHTDPIGMSAASSAVSNHQPSLTPAQNAIGFAREVDSSIQQFSFIDGIASVAKMVVPLVSQAAEYIGPMLL